jgi:hypothetical protein
MKGGTMAFDVGVFGNMGEMFVERVMRWESG